MLESIENNVTIKGLVKSNFEFDHKIYGENFYKTHVGVARTSGTIDTIPVIVSDRLIDIQQDWCGKQVDVVGQFRSYNKEDDDKVRLILYVFAREFKELEDSCIDENEIELIGYICKDIVLRKTAHGRNISDIMLAVNRLYHKSDYIPCICWGRNAKYVSDINVGKKLHIKGRIQSREYIKRIDEEHTEERVAYEVSVSKVGLVVESEE